MKLAKQYFQKKKDESDEFDNRLKDKARLIFPSLRDETYHPWRNFICSIIGHIDDIGGEHEVCSRCGHIQKDIGMYFGYCIIYLGYISLSQTSGGTET